MSGRELLLPPAVRYRLEKLALAAQPEECCGVLLGCEAGDRLTVEQLLPTGNVASGDRRRYYQVDPRALAAAQRVARKRHRSVIGFFHSHPSGGVEPSGLDLHHAWPGVCYLILAVRGETVEIAGWRLAAEAAA